MTATLQRDKDIILIPRDWWKDKAESLEPEDLVVHSQQSNKIPHMQSMHRTEGGGP